ncbi:MAG TPA: hypothetical protein VFC05_07520 [Nitrososphaeraceae archaeon]|nr:hypothetical protein [Nitrososphaeraceae archaeon]
MTTFLIITLTMSTVVGNSFAHTFTNNESAAFLALIDNMKIQASLIQQSISSGNIDIAKQHIDKLKELYSNHTNEEIAEKNERIANEISTTINYFTSSSNQNNFSQSQIGSNVQNLNAILDESISVRIPKDVLDNSTVHALHFVELVNGVDMNYNSTLGEQDIQNMSLLNNKSRSQIEDIVSYNTARDLLNVAIDLYESKLKSKIIVNNNNSETIDKLQEGIKQLETSIEMKKPSSEITNIIIGVVYPTLQELYNFKLGEEEHAHTEEKEYSGALKTVRDSVTVLLEGLSIPATDFIHLYDSTPYHIMNGQVALKVPCGDDSTSPITVLIGSAPNMTTGTLENLPTLSTPGEQCLYHVDLIPDGNLTTITDIALSNTGEEDIQFPPTATVVIGINKVTKGEHGGEHSESPEEHASITNTTAAAAEAEHTE